MHQSLADHELWELAGLNVETSYNKMLLPTTKGSGLTTTQRTVHQGRHRERVKRELEVRMDRIIVKGKERGYTQEEYKRELMSIMQEEYRGLKSGERVLNNAKDFRKLPEGSK